MTLHHKYITKDDLLYEDENKRYLLIRPESNYGLSKIRHYVRFCGWRYGGHHTDKTYIVKSTEQYPIMVYSINMNKFNMDTMDLMTENRDIFFTTNTLSKSKILRQWVEDLKLFLLHDKNVRFETNTIGVKAYVFVNKYFILKDLELWRQIFSYEELKILFDKHNAKIPEHYVESGKKLNVPQIVIDDMDYDVLMGNSHIIALFKTHSTERIKKGLWLYPSSGIRNISYFPFFIFGEEKPEWIVISGCEEVNEEWKIDLMKMGYPVDSIYLHKGEMIATLRTFV